MNNPNKNLRPQLASRATKLQALYWHFKLKAIGDARLDRRGYRKIPCWQCKRWFRTLKRGKDHYDYLCKQCEKVQRIEGLVK